MNIKNVPYLYAALWFLVISVYGGAKYAKADTQPCVDAIHSQYQTQIATTLAEFEETSPDHYTVDHLLVKDGEGKFYRKDGMTCVIENGHVELGNIN
ncbi:hypothetical protein [Vibrio sp. TBV020]|uniref:hypothetical protein n=1 Tax=Vibrio sp. TBV020 TaxID=3137398 RepID=UPI0038CD8E81